jgi:hypothetical protein
LLPGRTILLQQIQATQFAQNPILCFQPVQPFVAQTQRKINLFEKGWRDTRFELLNDRWIKLWKWGGTRL